MPGATVQKCLEGNCFGAAFDTALQSVPHKPSGTVVSGCKVLSSHPRCLRQKKRSGSICHGVGEHLATLPFGGRAEQQRRKAPVAAMGKETSNGYVPLESRQDALKQSDGGSPGSPRGDGEVQNPASGGPKGDLTVEQKAALQALDAQLNRLSDSDTRAGQLSARRRFAEDLARKSGRAVPSENPPSKRTLAGDYLDKAAWNQKAAADKGFELDDTFLAYTSAALLVLTLVTNLVLNKFFPLPTKAQIKEMRRKDEAFMYSQKADTQDTDLVSAPPLRGP